MYINILSSCHGCISSPERELGESLGFSRAFQGADAAWLCWVFKHFRLAQILAQQWIPGVLFISIQYLCQGSRQRCAVDVGRASGSAGAWGALRNQEKIQEQSGFSG